MKTALVSAFVALVCGFAGAALWSFSGLGDSHRRDWLVANPDVLPAMAAALQDRETQAKLTEMGTAVTNPFPGAVLGNPQGARTLVKFSDYGCTYCRTSVADVERLIAGDPQLRVVIREWPIFDGSEDAARMALAAARQGKYAAFYKAMFAAGPPSASTIARASAVAGLDLEKARRDAATDAVTAELSQTMQLARTLDFSGTPSWVAGGRALQGAVGHDALKQALDSDDPA